MATTAALEVGVTAAGDVDAEHGDGREAGEVRRHVDLVAGDRRRLGASVEAHVRQPGRDRRVGDDVAVVRQRLVVRLLRPVLREHEVEALGVGGDHDARGRADEAGGAVGTVDGQLVELLR